jgi:hypothetical protein
MAFSRQGGLGCMGHSWYLSVDFQLHLLTPWLLALFRWRPNAVRARNGQSAFLCLVFCVLCFESSWWLSSRACLDKPWKSIFRLQLLGWYQLVPATTSCTQPKTPWFSPVGVSHNVGNDPRLPGIPPLPGAKRVVLFLVLLKRTLRITIASLARQARDKPTQETFGNGATFLLSKTVRCFLLTGPSCELQHVRSGGGGYADG